MTRRSFLAMLGFAPAIAVGAAAKASAAPTAGVLRCSVASSETGAMCGTAITEPFAFSSADGALRIATSRLAESGHSMIAIYADQIEVATGPRNPLAGI